MTRLLEMMLNDLTAAPVLYQPTTFWKIGVERVCDDLEKFGVENFRNLASILSFFAPKFGFPDYFLKPETYRRISEKVIEENRLPQRYRLALDQFFFRGNPGPLRLQGLQGDNDPDPSLCGQDQ